LLVSGSLPVWWPARFLGVGGGLVIGDGYGGSAAGGVGIVG
jgi:hypothetical protein